MKITEIDSLKLENIQLKVSALMSQVEKLRVEQGKILKIYADKAGRKVEEITGINPETLELSFLDIPAQTEAEKQ